MAASVVQAVKSALSALDEGGVPKELREVAFKRLLDEYLGGQPAGSRNDRTTAPDGDHNGGGDGSELERIATKLGVDQAQIEQVFDADEHGIHLNVSRSRLDSKTKGAAQEVARLVAAGRQAGGQEEWTPLEAIGDAADDPDVKDSNFSKHMTAMGGDGLRVRGSGRQREIKLNNVGFEAAAAIVRRVTE